ncbi:MAG: PDZ domain-containing protein [Cyanosarcina radialis HA8281-LM2]|jgi:carboxyl-terminal processing protease|nr:PDZ domain-containing protein [Cyanosarcina radialis HA8281-LM2]
MKENLKKLPILSKVILGSAVAATSALFLSAPLVQGGARAALQDSPKAVVDEVWQIVNRDYVDGSFNQVNWQATRQELLSRNYSSREEAYAAIKEALKKLGDPFTRFMTPQDYKALTSQTEGEISGIGIRLGIKEEDRSLVVVEPIENSPASKAGVKSGDALVAIDGKPTKGMTVEQASELIRGEAGTKVSLKLEREGQGAFDLTLTRAQIELSSVRYLVKNEGKIRVGYIRLDEFTAHSAEQMKRAIAKLSNEKVNGFILDLRGNPGGLLVASVDIARMWLDNGAIVKIVDRRGSNDELKANRTAITKLPLAILVDGNSASASEILSGALKDNRRATIVGSQTYGKALVQSVHELSDGSGLAVTVAHYYTPNGTDISHKGVTPDVKLDLTADQLRQLAANPTWIATPNDPQYARAIAVLANPNAAQPVFSPRKPQLGSR